MRAMRRPTTTLSLLAAQGVTVAALTAFVAAPAVAQGDDDKEVRTNGSCSGSTSWKMKAKADDGRIEVESEVDSNKVGQNWNWKLKDNGALVSSGSSKTTGPSGSFEVERKPANRAGTDHFVFRAVNPKSGEVCRGTVSW
jgi:hypothetical protein